MTQEPQRGAGAAQPAGAQHDVAEPVGADPSKPTLSLGDPLNGRATEDRPEAWGERSESDADRLAHYEAQRPPHHGG